MPATETSTRRDVSRVRGVQASRQAPSRPRFEKDSVKTGMNAAERAPSPNSSRSMFGSRKAAKKASVAVPAPKALAMIRSRTNPRTRLSRVAPLTTPAARAIPPGFSCSIRNPLTSLCHSSLMNATARPNPYEAGPTKERCTDADYQISRETVEEEPDTTPSQSRGKEQRKNGHQEGTGRVRGAGPGGGGKGLRARRSVD